MKYSIQDAHKIAYEHGGQCLSSVYSSKKLEWKCADNHIWTAKFYSVQSGSWCPYCTWHWKEEKCRYIFETIYQCKFPRNRTIIKGMELDGYCNSLKLAFEYHGIQHYQKLGDFWAVNYNKRLKQDELRRKKCFAMGIKLIEIPYFEANTDNNLVNYIIKILGTDSVIDWTNFYSNLSVIKTLRKLAQRNGGRLVSNFYNGSHIPLIWECKQGHQWDSTPHDIKRGCWCAVCKGNLYTIEDVKRSAILRGGECLSNEYTNNRTVMSWKCNKGHVWSAIFDNIIKGSWCPICSGVSKMSIAEMQVIAATRGGKCLSHKYMNRNTHLLWECKMGHQWWATPGHVKYDTWCPYCNCGSNIVKPIIEDMQIIAEQRNGECLSEFYINAHTPLTWKCEHGHKWMASPTNVKSGKWCPKCFKNKRRIYDKGEK